MGNLESWISRHRTRLAQGVFLAAFADAMAVFLLAFGTIVLAVKLTQPAWWPHVLWLAAAAVLAVAWSWIAMRRQSFSRRQAVALLDSRVGAGGLLMTLSETFDPQWAQQLASRNPEWSAGLPRLRPARAARRLWLPVLFALGSCLIPPREARTETVRPNVVGSHVAESLNETLSLLKENEVLEQKESQELKDAIDKLAEETKQSPLSHESWERVDALKDAMRVRTEDSLMAVATAQSALESLAADAAKSGEKLSSQRREQLENEATESLRKMSKSGRFKAASPELQRKLQSLMKDGKLRLPKDPSEREKVLSDLKQFLKEESQKLAKCRGKCKDGQCESDSDDFNSTDHSEQDGGAGRGGVTRGRGDAKLTWGDEAEADGAKFKEIILPPGTPDQPNKEVISQSAANPDVKPAAAAPRAAVRNAGPTTGQQTWSRTLRPRHRDAVRRYFESTSR